MNFKTSIITILTLISLPLKASIITYNESIDGDLPMFNQLPNANAQFILNEGLHTFSGDVTWSYNQNIEEDFDFFNFELASGYYLSSIVADVQLQNNVGSGVFDDAHFVISSTTVWDGIHYIYNIPSGPLNILTSELPVYEGTNYLFGFGGAGGILNVNDYRTVNYDLTFEVKKVSEPYTIILMAFSLFPLIRRNKQGCKYPPFVQFTQKKPLM